MTDENTTTKASKETKSRVFTFLLYKDSAPDDFVELLTSQQAFPVAVSPLHDKDLVENPEDTPEAYLKEYGGFKKPHYHCIIVSNNSLTPSAIQKRLQHALGKEEAVGMVQICHHIKGAYEYLTHESVDAKKKNKHVYPREQIVHINNFDITRYVTISADERKQNLNIVLDLIYNNHLCNVFELRDFISEHPDCGIDWAAACDVTDARGGTLRLYFDGAYQRVQREERKNQHNHLLGALGEMHEQMQSLWAYTTELEEKMRRSQ